MLEQSLPQSPQRGVDQLGGGAREVYLSAGFAQAFEVGPGGLGHGLRGLAVHAAKERVEAASSPVPLAVVHCIGEVQAGPQSGPEASQYGHRIRSLADASQMPEGFGQHRLGGAGDLRKAWLVEALCGLLASGELAQGGDLIAPTLQVSLGGLGATPGPGEDRPSPKRGFVV